MDQENQSYEQTALNKVGRMKDRARYDYETVHSILDAAAYWTLGFVDPQGQPQIVPILGTLDVNDETGEIYAYLHGYVGARFVKINEEAGLPLTVNATLMDGYVMALSAFHHSMNYRSATLHGVSDPIDPKDLKTKRYAAQLIVEGAIAGRWENCKQPTDAELLSTGILRMKIESGSAKVRTGPPKDDKPDLENSDLTTSIWTGVVPVKLTTENPKPNESNRVRDVPQYVEKLRAKIDKLAST